VSYNQKEFSQSIVFNCGFHKHHGFSIVTQIWFLNCYLILIVLFSFYFSRFLKNNMMKLEMCCGFMEVEDSKVKVIDGGLQIYHIM